MYVSVESKSVSKNYMQKAVKFDSLKMVYFSFLEPLVYMRTEYLGHKTECK